MAKVLSGVDAKAGCTFDVSDGDVTPGNIHPCDVDRLYPDGFYVSQPAGDGNCGTYFTTDGSNSIDPNSLMLSSDCAVSHNARNPDGGFVLYDINAVSYASTKGNDGPVSYVVR